MLLADNSSVEHADVDATNLIRLLCASVKKAVGEKIVPATDNRKQYYTKAQRVSESSVICFCSVVVEDFKNTTLSSRVSMLSQVLRNKLDC